MKVRRQLAASFIGALLIAACTASSSRPPPQVSEVRCANDTVATASPARPGCPSSLQESVVGRAICGAPFVGERSGEFTPPTDGVFANFQRAMTAVLGDPATALDVGSLWLRAEVMEDAQERYTVVTEVAPCGRGAGVFVIRHQPTWNVVVEVPHVGFEQETLAQGFGLLRAGARALFVAGSHRCASRDVTPCRGGQGGVCGEPSGYRTSDVAAFARTFFQAAHAATLALKDRPVVVSLHGKKPGADPVTVIVSDGTRRPGDDSSWSRRLADALARRGITAASCQSRADLRLCGTGSVQGRASNGAADACLGEPPTSSGLFLHVEQDYDKIEAQVAPRLEDALRELFAR